MNSVKRHMPVRSSARVNGLSYRDPILLGAIAFNDAWARIYLRTLKVAARELIKNDSLQSPALKLENRKVIERTILYIEDVISEMRVMNDITQAVSIKGIEDANVVNRNAFNDEFLTELIKMLD